MKVMLYGKEHDFSEEELVSILEDHFERQAMEADFIDTVTSTPAEGCWFIVRPKLINRSIFEEKREDIKQENVRQEILKAFDEMHKYPEKYSEPFKTLYPTRPWSKKKSKTLKELRNMAKIIGDDVADETQQALEWAQRIFNGESWEMVCNNPDNARSYRAIKTRYYGMYLLVGGSKDAQVNSKVEPAHVLQENYMYFEKVGCTVPLVVSHQNIPHNY